MAMNYRELRATYDQASQLMEDCLRLVKTRANLILSLETTTKQIAISKLMAELENIPIEQIRQASDQRLSIEPLIRDGYLTVYDVHRTSNEDLAKSSGVSLSSAAEIHVITTKMLEAIEAGISTRIDIDKPSTPDLQVINQLRKLDELNQATQGSLKDFSILASRLRADLRYAEAFKSRRSWILTRASNRATAATVMANTRAILNEPSTEYLEQEVSRLLSIVTSEIPDDFALKELFVEKSNDFYSLLDSISDKPDTTIALKTLNQELVQHINTEPFDPNLIKATLRRYQTFGIKFALAQKRVILGDEMGLGKTIQALGVLAQRYADGAKKFVVVCPASVIVNWSREIESRTNLQFHKIHGINKHEAFKQWNDSDGIALTTFDGLKSIFLTAEDIRDLTIDTLIVDEAHFAKNVDTGRSKEIYKWSNAIPRVMFLSGTPMENRISEFIGLVAMLDLKISRSLDKVVLASGPEPFRQAVAPIYLRRNASEVLKELPPLVEVEEYCDWDEVTSDAYYKAVETGNFMAMRRAAYVTENDSIPEKLNRIIELVDEAFENQQSVIVFSYFRDVLRLIHQHLGEKAYEPITGSISPKSRQALIDDFNESKEPRVLIGQIMAAGTGLNIQKASVIIMCEPQIKPTLETQAIARAHRMGQLRAVQVHRLVIPEGVDVRMQDILSAKTAEFDSYARPSALAQSAPEAKEVSEESVSKLIVQLERERLGIVTV
jgi:SNF2 family DNA or RNA helicase